MSVLETTRKLVRSTSPQVLQLKPKVIFEDNTKKCFFMLSKYFTVVDSHSLTSSLLLFLG